MVFYNTFCYKLSIASPGYAATSSDAIPSGWAGDFLRSRYAANRSDSDAHFFGRPIVARILEQDWSSQRDARIHQAQPWQRLSLGIALLAKQVLSQLSYTPTAGTSIDFRAFATVRKLQNISCSPLLRQNSAMTTITSAPLCRSSGFSLARRLILAGASLFICNFICGYFLNTWESPSV